MRSGCCSTDWNSTDYLVLIIDWVHLWEVEFGRMWHVLICYACVEVGLKRIGTWWWGLEGRKEWLFELGRLVCCLQKHMPDFPKEVLNRAMNWGIGITYSSLGCWTRTRDESLEVLGFCHEKEEFLIVQKLENQKWKVNYRELRR